ncbi:MAG TPA: hypothetical protein VGB95_06020 [Chitinophagales bacterium]
MKKVLFVATAIVALVTVSSCKKKDCVTCSGVKVCEDSYSSSGSGVSWSDYKAAAITAGCTESN